MNKDKIIEEIKKLNSKVKAEKFDAALQNNIRSLFSAIETCNELTEEEKREMIKKVKELHSKNEEKFLFREI